MATTTQQYVWIVRYGLTEFPLVENEGPFDSDIDPKEGIDHANAIAHKIASDPTKAPALVYASPFLRTVHTAHIVAQALPSKDDSNLVKIEQGLAEWQTPSLLVVAKDSTLTVPKSPAVHAQRFDSIDTDYVSLNPVGGKETLQDEESEEQLYKRCQHTLQQILQHAQGENIAIVSHAPCDIAMALALNNTNLEQAKGGKDYEPWPLGGLTLFAKDGGTEDTDPCQGWKMVLYGDSNHMPDKYKEGLKRWTLPSLSD